MDRRFELLYEALKDLEKNYLHYVYTTTATILLVIGWLLNSRPTRDLIAEQPLVLGALVVVVAFFLVAEAGVIHWLCRGSEKIARMMDELEECAVPPRYYAFRIVRRRPATLFLAAHAGLYLFLLIVVFAA